MFQEQLRAKQHSGSDSPATRNELANIISNIMRLNHFKNNNNRPFNRLVGHTLSWSVVYVSVVGTGTENYST